MLLLGYILERFTKNTFHHIFYELSRRNLDYYTVSLPHSRRLKTLADNAVWPGEEMNDAKTRSADNCDRPRDRP